MVRQILVVKREVLFKDGLFQGFAELKDRNYLETIMANFGYRERNKELENDPSFLQVIPYMWIVNGKQKKIFVYRRDKGADYKEERHVNKYSTGVGGHIDLEKVTVDPITDALNREMREEVEIMCGGVAIGEYPSFRFVGYVHGEQDTYEKVHLGMIAVAETEHDVRSKATDKGLREGRLYSVAELEALMQSPDAEFDKWTIATWPFVKAHFLN